MLSRVLLRVYRTAEVMKKSSVENMKKVSRQL